MPQKNPRWRSPSAPPKQTVQASQKVGKRNRKTSAIKVRVFIFIYSANLFVNDPDVGDNDKDKNSEKENGADKKSINSHSFRTEMHEKKEQ